MHIHFHTIARLALLGALPLAFTPGCADDPPDRADVVGRWKNTSAGMARTYIFHADGRFKLRTDENAPGDDFSPHQLEQTLQTVATDAFISHADTWKLEGRSLHFTSKDGPGSLPISLKIYNLTDQYLALETGDHLLKLTRIKPEEDTEPTTHTNNDANPAADTPADTNANDTPSNENSSP